MAAALSLARVVAGPPGLQQEDDRLRILSLLCLTSVVYVAGDEFLPLLPPVLPTALGYLQEATSEGKADLHNAAYALLCAVADQLAFVFSGSYLDDSLRASYQSAALQQSRGAVRAQFYQSVAHHVPAEGLFASLGRTWTACVDWGYPVRVGVGAKQC